MKTIGRIALCLIAFAVVFIGAIDTVAGQPSSREPIVSLSVNNLPLGEALATLSRDTGYRFHLDSQWKAHPVSVNFAKIPLEEALKRLLRNLNHSIIWESEDSIRIMVYGASEGAGSAPAVSFAAPPQEIPEEVEPFDTADAPADESAEESVEESPEERDQNDAAEASEEMAPDVEEDGVGGNTDADLPEETSEAPE